MLLRTEVICDSQSRPCRIVGYQLDISQQRRRVEDQARFAAIVESSEDAIISKSLEGIITSWNEDARRLFGYSRRDARSAGGSDYTG
jgi:PAS domain-containing protein